MTYVTLDTMLDTLADPSNSLFRNRRKPLRCQSSMSTLYPLQLQTFSIDRHFSEHISMESCVIYSSGLGFTIMDVDDFKRRHQLLALV